MKGWANYYSTVVSSDAYKSQDNLIYIKPITWAKRRHPNKSAGWVVKKYWQTIEGANWVFATRAEGKNPNNDLSY
ncbi:group II intron maturase-specific domain-containing protein [uncultured Nostoc sp.]|uniref:group II intron maturase-specific domain-containing protein n=1 Tax=uncultured Nostoc sp. TaxID=340711 RepID=UPI0035CB7CD8